MRVYVGSGLENRDRVAMVLEYCVHVGHQITYNWTRHGDVRREGPDVMNYVSTNEVRAVRDAELVLILLPGGKGTHIELGVALGSRGNKRILLWSEDPAVFEDPELTCVFYQHPAIERLCCSFAELFEHIPVY